MKSTPGIKLRTAIEGKVKYELNYLEIRIFITKKFLRLIWYYNDITIYYILQRYDIYKRFVHIFSKNPQNAQYTYIYTIS